MHESNEKMLHLLEYLQMILNVFRPAFSRQASSANFKVTITGFLIEDEVNTVTDLVRYFDYPEPDKLYERLISFFLFDNGSAEGMGWCHRRAQLPRQDWKVQPTCRGWGESCKVRQCNGLCKENAPRVSIDSHLLYMHTRMI